MKARYMEAVWHASGEERTTDARALRPPRAVLTNLETCVLERDGSVGIEAWNALQELAQRSIPLCVITDRSIPQMARFYADFGLHGLVAFEGGAGVVRLPEAHVVDTHPAALSAAELLDLLTGLRRGPVRGPGARALGLRLVSEVAHDEVAELLGCIGPDLTAFCARRHSLPLLCPPASRRALQEALAAHPEVALRATGSSVHLLLGHHHGADLVARMLAPLRGDEGPVLGLASALHDFPILTAADEPVIVPAEGGSTPLASSCPGARCAPHAGGRGWAWVVREALGRG